MLLCGVQALEFCQCCLLSQIGRQLQASCTVAVKCSHVPEQGVTQGLCATQNDTNTCCHTQCNSATNVCIAGAPCSADLPA